MNNKALKINKNGEDKRKARNEKYGFVMIDNNIRQRISKECGGNALCVYLELLNRLNHKSGLCCPSTVTISDATGLSDKTVKRAIKTLKDNGFIDWEQSKASSNNFKVNNYFFLYPAQAVEDKAEEVAEIKAQEPAKSKVIPLPTRPVLGQTPAPSNIRQRLNINFAGAPVPNTVQNKVINMPNNTVSNTVENKAENTDKNKSMNSINTMIEEINRIEENVISKERAKNYKEKAKIDSNSYRAVVEELNNLARESAMTIYFDWDECKTVKQIKKGCESIKQIDINTNKIITIKMDLAA